MPAPKKNPLTKLGGKAAKAIQKKAAKEFGMSKPTTKGKAKVSTRLRNIEKMANEEMYPDSVSLSYKKKKLTSTLSGQPGGDIKVKFGNKVKPRNINKTIKSYERAVSKNNSGLRKALRKPMPVKKRSK